jgi:hypothetical protein
MLSHRFSHLLHSDHHFSPDEIIVFLILAAVIAFYALALPVILYGPQAFAFYGSAFRDIYKLSSPF